MEEQDALPTVPHHLSDPDARDLIAVVYNELRVLARKYLAGERHNHTLQPTALVHEAYARIIEQQVTPWKDRNHFFAVAAKTMRRVLVDYARRSKAEKREHTPIQITLDDRIQDHLDHTLFVEEIDAALAELAALDPRQSQIVEMRFFGGLSIQECADVLGISKRTVNGDWQMARAWLYGRLSEQNRHEP